MREPLLKSQISLANHCGRTDKIFKLYDCCCCDACNADNDTGNVSTGDVFDGNCYVGNEGIGNSS